MGTRQEELDAIENTQQMLKRQVDITDELEDLRKEIQLLRKGHEASTWGEEVKDMEDANLEDIEL